MSATIAEIKDEVCSGCGDRLGEVYVDYLDCGGLGVTLKAGGGWVDLSPQMIADLVDVLIEWQNRDY